MQLFDDEILSVVLKFTNPSRGEMVDAGKVASGLSLALDNVIRKSVSAGKALNDIYEGISKLGPELKSLEKRSGLIQGQVGALRSAQQILARYTPARLEKMAEVQASRIAESSGTAALRRQLEKHGATIQKLVDVTDDKKQRAAGHTPDSDLTREQRLLSIIRQEARELRHELTQKLAEADRLNWSRPFVSSRAQVSTPELRSLEQQRGDIYTMLAVVSRERDSHERIAPLGNRPFARLMRDRQAIGGVQPFGAACGVCIGRVEKYASQPMPVCDRWAAHARPVSAADAHVPESICKGANPADKEFAPPCVAKVRKLAVDAPPCVAGDADACG